MGKKPDRARNPSGRQSEKILPQFREAMTESGYQRVSELWLAFAAARQESGKNPESSYQSILDVSQGKAFTSDGGMHSRTANLVAEFLGVPPASLFGEPPAMTRIAEQERCGPVCEAGYSQPELTLLQAQRARALDHILKRLESLDQKGAKILSLRFGLEDGQERSRSDIVKITGYTSSRIVFLEAQALKKLKALASRDEGLNRLLKP